MIPRQRPLDARKSARTIASRVCLLPLLVVLLIGCSSSRDGEARRASLMVGKVRTAMLRHSFHSEASSRVSQLRSGGGRSSSLGGMDGRMDEDARARTRVLVERADPQDGDEEIIARGHYAERDLGKHGYGRWTCTPYRGSRGTWDGLYSDPSYAPLVLISPNPVVSRRVIGSGRVGGTPVWILRTLENDQRLVMRTVLTDWISKKDWTVLEEANRDYITFHNGKRFLRREVIRFSRFGEAVRPQLPAACRKGR